MEISTRLSVVWASNHSHVQQKRVWTPYPVDFRGLWWITRPSLPSRLFENDFGGLWWTVYLVHGIQKVRGSNPLGSTKFLRSKSSRSRARADRARAVARLFGTLSHPLFLTVPC